MIGNKKIAMLGTFDVDNYGDLLFPFIAEHRLIDYELVFISPTRNKTVFDDAKSVISFNEFKQTKFDGILIGGGNILHLLSNFTTAYNSKGFSYADLWIGAVNYASKIKVPSVFNAPGIAHQFKHKHEIKLIKETFESCNYISLRDNQSKDIIKGIIKDTDKINVVPDTALEINEMWPFKNESINNDVCINLNERYHGDIKETAKWVELIANKTNLNIKFIVIGDCHGDLDFTKKVANEIKCNKIIVESNNLKKVAHTIANSKLFLGSSMHAFISAISYGVPAFLVLKENPKHKFKGLLDLCDLEYNCLCTSFENCYNNLDKPASITLNTRENIKIKLDNHWKAINDIFKSGVPTKNTTYCKNYIRTLSKINKKNFLRRGVDKIKRSIK
jgi:polysaccharide pyruvyl transferase WcaK-like protein